MWRRLGDSGRQFRIAQPPDLIPEACLMDSSYCVDSKKDLGHATMSIADCPSIVALLRHTERLQQSLCS